jgi:hypothetical protein
MANMASYAGALLAAASLALGAAQAVAAPVQEARGEVRALHGGVGEEDRSAMERSAGEYNLRLTFARQGSGAYLSQVRVVIRNAQGAVMLDTISSGPWLFARLPQGQYIAEATEADRTLTQKIDIQGASRREWVFRFAAPANE